MATSKTLTPTNVTIQIPEFTDQPDQRVNSNCLDKEADAINALNTKLGNIDTSTAITDLDNVPVNSQGRITLGASVSPTGAQASFDYHCYGSNAYRALLVVNTSSNQEYINSRHSSTTWKGWREANSVPVNGAWSGNQTVANIQQNVVRSGVNYCYLQDTTYGNGWSSVFSQIDSGHKGILIINDSKLIFTRATGTSWTTHSINLS